MLDLVTCTGALWTSLATVNECRVSVRVRISLNVCVASQHPNLTRSMHTFIHTQEHCYMDTKRYRHIHIHADRLADSLSDRQTDRQTDIQAVRLTSRQAGRHAALHA